MVRDCEASTASMCLRALGVGVEMRFSWWDLRKLDLLVTDGKSALFAGFTCGAAVDGIFNAIE